MALKRVRFDLRGTHLTAAAVVAVAVAVSTATAVVQQKICDTWVGTVLMIDLASSSRSSRRNVYRFFFFTAWRHYSLILLSFWVHAVGAGGFVFFFPLCCLFVLFFLAAFSAVVVDPASSASTATALYTSTRYIFIFVMSRETERQT